jgi:hypothetical protein
LAIANNPTQSVAQLFALLPSSPPFQPALTTMPAGYTVPLTTPMGLSVSPTSIAFPGAYLSRSTTQMLTLTNQGTTTIAISSSNIVGASSADFIEGNVCSSLAAGATCTVSVTFTPSVTRTEFATLQIMSNAPNSLVNIPLTGEGLADSVISFSVAPTALSFTQAGVPQTITMTNNGAAAVGIGSIAVTSTLNNIAETNTCGTVLAALSNCAISVQIGSLGLTAGTGTVTVAAGIGANTSTGAVQVTEPASSVNFSASAITFGDWALGITSPTEIVSVDSGDMMSAAPPLNGTITGTNAADFSLPQGNCSSGTFQCQLAVAFTPGGLGDRSATLVTEYGDVPLIGTGAAVGPSFKIAPFPTVPETLNISSQATSLSVMNNGSVPLLLTKITVAGAAESDFAVSDGSCSSTLNSAQNCTLSVVFTPSQLGTRTATLTLTDATSGISSTVTLSGTGLPTPPVITPNPLAFGVTQVGTSSTAQTAIVSTPNGDPVSISAIVGGANSEFSLSNGACATHTPCQISAAFTPSSLGSQTSTYSVLDTVTQRTTTFSLQGMGGQATLSASSTSVTFAETNPGTTSAAQTVTLTDTGTMPLMISGITLSGTNAANFAITANTCSSGVLPGASCAISVNFTPTTGGAFSATLQLASNALNSPITNISLNGTGTIAQSGLVQSGLTPVSAATIQMYAVGTIGDGSAATPLFSTPLISDTNGKFNFGSMYTCPSTTSLVYMVATGGDPGLGAGNSNPQLGLMVALGQCGSLTQAPMVTLNELTTVASVWPLAPYMTSPSAVGSGSGDAAGLAAAFTLASQLANPNTGKLPGSNVPAGEQVPIERINTLADLLLTCNGTIGGIAYDGSACGNLFAYTPLGGGAYPTSVLGAALVIADNPTLNVYDLWYIGYELGWVFSPTLSLSPPPVDNTVRLVTTSGLTITPSSLTFPDENIGFSSPTQVITVTNTGTSAVSLNWGAEIGDIGDFPANIGCSMGVGESCSIPVNFIPTAAGARSTSLNFVAYPSDQTVSIPLSGRGLAPSGGPITLSPSSLNFPLGGVPQTVTMTNTGTTPVTISSIIADSIYTQTNNCGATLDPQSICQIAVQAIEVYGYASPGHLTVVESSSASPETVQLSNPPVSPSVAYFSTAPLAFGSVKVGSTGPSQSIGATGNSYYDPTPQLIVFSVTGPNVSDFSLDQNGCGGVIECSITFIPSAPGLRTATLVTNLGNIELIGAGDGDGAAFTLTPNNFPAIVIPGYVGTITLANTGPVPLLLSPSPGARVNGGISEILSSGTFALFPSTGCGTFLPAGASCQLPLYFNGSDKGMQTGTLTFTDLISGVSNTLIVNGMGGAKATAPVPSPASLVFGNTQVGATSSAQTITITATNGDPVIFSSKATNNFIFGTGTCAIQTPCQVSVQFRPSATGQLTGALGIYDTTTGASSSVSLQGTGGVPTVSLSPTSLIFSARNVGSTSISQVVTVTNSGSSTLTVSGVPLVGTNPGDFIVESNTCSSVASGGNCTISVSFDPTASGARSAILQIVSNASTSPSEVQLNGTGN